VIEVPSFAPFPLWKHVVVVWVCPFLKAIALELTRGASANAAVTAIMTAANASVLVFIEIL
jgi:hypothetical protein